MIRTIFLSLCLLLLVSCSHEPEKAPVASNSTEKPDSAFFTLSEGETMQSHLKFDTAKVRNLPIRIELASTVQPDETFTMPVSSLVPGRAEQVLVKLGDTVKQGQVLATVRSEMVGTIQTDFLQRVLELRAEAKQRQLELQAESKQYSTKAEFLRKHFQRKSFLSENKIGSKAELESAQSEMLQVEAALEATGAKARAAREAAESKERALFISSKEKLKIYGLPELDIDRVARSGTVKSIFQIRAPKTGMITTRDIDPGETTDANQHLFVITDLSQVWLIGQIFEKDLRHLSVGMPVACFVESYPGLEFKGRIEYLGAKLDPQTRSLPIRVSVKNDGLKLRPDMFGHINITVGQEKVLTVPKEALQTIGEVQIVYVQKENNRFERRKVTLGNEVDNFVEITEGLTEGEHIVTSGSVDLLGKTLQSMKQ